MVKKSLSCRGPISQCWSESLFATSSFKRSCWSYIGAHSLSWRFAVFGEGQQKAPPAAQRQEGPPL